MSPRAFLLGWWGGHDGKQFVVVVVDPTQGSVLDLKLRNLDDNGRNTVLPIGSSGSLVQSSGIHSDPAIV